MTRRLADHRRIVVKIGSATLVDAARGLVRQPWFDTLVDATR